MHKLNNCILLLFLLISITYVSSKSLNSLRGKIIDKSESLLQQQQNQKKFVNVNQVKSEHQEFTQLENTKVVTSRKSWGQHFKESIAKCIIGFMMFVISFPLLWYNERRAVKTEKILDDGFKNCLKTSLEQVNEVQNGCLVHVQGETSAKDQKVIDSELNLTREDVLYLKRKVYMYQYIEERHTESQRDIFGGGSDEVTTIEYKQQWIDHLVDSSNYDEHYKNLTQWIFSEQKTYAEVVNVGKFELSKEQIDKLKKEEIITGIDKLFSDKDQFNKIIEDKQFAFAKYNAIQFTDNCIFLKQADFQEQVGDIKIEFYELKPGPITILAEQQGNKLIPYIIDKQSLEDEKEKQRLLDQKQKQDEENFNASSQDTCCCCACFNMCCCLYTVADESCKHPDRFDEVFEESLTQKQCFVILAQRNAGLTKWARFGGWLLMLFGFYLIFSPFYEVLQILPLLSAIGKFLIFVVALVLSTVFSLIVISLAWLFYRPLYGIFVLMLVGGLVYLIVQQSKEAQKIKTF